MTEIEGKERPLPRRGDHFSNLKVETTMKVKRGPGRPAKNLKQINMKLEPDVLDRFIAAFDAAAAQRSGLTRSDFLRKALDALEKRPATDTAPVRKTPTAKDREQGRTVHRDLWLNPDLAATLDKRAAAPGLTFSATIEQMTIRVGQTKAIEDENVELRRTLETWKQAKP